MLADMVGERVSATMPDMVTAPAKVNANSRNSAPVKPPCIPIGMYTATRVTVIAMTGETSSRAPSMAASRGVRPSRRCRSTFSTTTMASSTTRPTESTMASSVSRLRVKPNICIKNMLPMSDTGIAITGIRTERAEPRKRKITTITINSVSIKVPLTSWMASLT